MLLKKMNDKTRQAQSGATLIEVLVAVVILAFGLLSLGGMLSFAIQMPKLSAYRATATNLAASYVERIRANPNAFVNGSYAVGLNETVDWSFADIALSDCNYSSCTETTLATMDVAAVRRAVRRQLPAGDMIMKCDPNPCVQNGSGDLWIIWQEPSTFAALDPGTSDNCPTEATAIYTNPAPRCLYVRFRVE